MHISNPECPLKETLPAYVTENSDSPKPPLNSPNLTAREAAFVLGGEKARTLGPEPGLVAWRTYREQPILPGTVKIKGYLFPKCTKCAHHGCTKCKQEDLEAIFPGKDGSMRWQCCLCGLMSKRMRTRGHGIIWVKPDNNCR